MLGCNKNSKGIILVLETERRDGNNNIREEWNI